MPSFFGSSRSSSSAAASTTASDSEELKNAFIKQVQAETAMNNARNLISKLNEHCFDRCIPSPGTSLSSQEETCLSMCMEKYISMWNTTSRAYLSRLNKESKKMGGQDPAVLASLAAPSSNGGGGILN